MSAPILRLPDLNKGFTLSFSLYILPDPLLTDASNVVTGAVLMHVTNEIKFPIAYASKKLLPRETRCSVIEKECLALV